MRKDGACNFKMLEMQMYIQVCFNSKMYRHFTCKAVNSRMALVLSDAITLEHNAGRALNRQHTAS